MSRSKPLSSLAALLGALLLAAPGASLAQAKAPPPKKPNILVIWGDDIGQFNVSAYNMGLDPIPFPHRSTN